MTKFNRTPRRTRSTSRKVEAAIAAASSTGSTSVNSHSSDRVQDEPSTNPRSRSSKKTYITIDTSGDNDETSVHDHNNAAAVQRALHPDRSPFITQNISQGEYVNQHRSKTHADSKASPLEPSPVGNQNLSWRSSERGSAVESEGRYVDRNEGLGDEQHRRLINAQIRRNSMIEIREAQNLTAKEKADQEMLLLMTCAISLSMALFLAYNRLTFIANELQCSCLYALKHLLFLFLQNFIWDLTQTSHIVSISVRLFWAFDHRWRYHSQTAQRSRQYLKRRLHYQNNIRICLDSLTALAAATSVVPLIFQTERVAAWWYILAYSTARGAQLLLTRLGADKRLGEVSILGVIMLIMTFIRWYPFLTDDLAISYRYADSYARYGGPFGGDLLKKIGASEDIVHVSETKPKLEVIPVEITDAEPIYLTTDFQSFLTTESRQQVSETDLDGSSQVQTATETIRPGVIDAITEQLSMTTAVPEVTEGLIQNFIEWFSRRKIYSRIAHSTSTVESAMMSIEVSTSAPSSGDDISTSSASSVDEKRSSTAFTSDNEISTSSYLSTDEHRSSPSFSSGDEQLSSDIAALETKEGLLRHFFEWYKGRKLYGGILFPTWTAEPTVIDGRNPTSFSSSSDEQPLSTTSSFNGEPHSSTTSSPSKEVPSTSAFISSDEQPSMSISSYSDEQPILATAAPEFRRGFLQNLFDWYGRQKKSSQVSDSTSAAESRTSNDEVPVSASSDDVRISSNNLGSDTSDRAYARPVNSVTSTTVTGTVIDAVRRSKKLAPPGKLKPSTETTRFGTVTSPVTIKQPKKITHAEEDSQMTTLTEEPLPRETTTYLSRPEGSSTNGYVAQFWSSVTARFKGKERDVTTWKFEAKSPKTTWRFHNEQNNHEQVDVEEYGV